MFCLDIPELPEYVASSKVLKIPGLLQKSICRPLSGGLIVGRSRLHLSALFKQYLSRKVALSNELGGNCGGSNEES